MPAPPPEPLMPLSIAARPGARERVVLVDEATAVRLQRDLAVILEGTRAAKGRMTGLLAPGARFDELAARQDAALATSGARLDAAAAVLDAAIRSGEPAVDFAPVYCGKRYQDGDGPSQECAEPAGHEPPCGDPALKADTGADDGELPAIVDGMRRMMCRQCRVRPVSHEPTAECPGNPMARPAPAAIVCMKVGCGHEAMLHALEPVSLDRLHCVRRGCACSRFLSPEALAKAPPPQCRAGLLREGEDWGAACQKDAGHEPPHDGQDGDWTDDHPRHVPDLDAHFPVPGGRPSDWSRWPDGLEDDGAPADPDELCDCAHSVGHHGAGVGRCDANGCGCPRVMITVIRATAADPGYPDVSGGGVPYAAAPSVVGTIVASIHDDSPVPVTGKVTGQVDEEWVDVAWGDQQDADYPSTRREALDELRGARTGGRA